MPPTREGRRAYYGSEHVARMEQIRDYQTRGLSLRDIALRLEESSNTTTASPNEILTFDDFAARIGLPVALVASMIAEGVLIPIAGEDGTPTFDHNDIAMANLALVLLGKGLPFFDLLLLAKDHHRRMEETISSAVDLFEKHLRVDPTTCDEGEILAEFETFKDLQASLTTLVSLHFTRLLLVRAQQRFQSNAGDLERARLEIIAMNHLRQ